MHYYSFNIADYKKDTDHLTPIEHYIYRSLIDRYYLDEKPITNETQSVMRRLQLRTDEDKTALKNVLSDFFYLDDDSYRHKRIDAELEKYQANAEKNRENGKKGGRPPKNKPKITQSVNDGLPVASQLKPNQEPITNNQEPRTNYIAFDSFWNAYDYKKGGVKKPQEKWLSLSEEQQQLIMAHVPDYVKSTPVKKFRKHPMTYLNNEGWLDEIDQPQPTNTQVENHEHSQPAQSRYDNHKQLLAAQLQQQFSSEETEQGIDNPYSGNVYEMDG